MIPSPSLTEAVGWALFILGFGVVWLALAGVLVWLWWTQRHG